MKPKLSHIDLFAGCGGLSLGLEQAGFELALAVEKSPMAAETFYHNFIERITDQAAFDKFASEATSVEEQAARGLVAKEVASLLRSPKVLAALKARDIDLVAGGPPCQGFSLAGRRNPDDLRNRLPWQFLQFVEAVCPKAVIIENVSGMRQDFKKHGKASPFDDLRVALAETGPGYCVQPVQLNAVHFGAPQNRPRVFLVALRKDIAAAAGFVASENVWRSDYDQIGSILFRSRPLVAPKATHFGDNVLTVKDALSDINANGYRRKSNIPSFAQEMRSDIGWLPARSREGHVPGKLKNHTTRKHAEHVETRFKLYQYLRDARIHSRILALPRQVGTPARLRKALVLQGLAGAPVPAIAPDGTVLATSRNGLADVIMSLGTKKHSQRSLDWDAPSPTIVSMPDDFVHPEEPRTLTVREMARIQSFPDSFEFRSKETTGSLRRRFEVPQYTQVGNAVPPKLARALGEAVRSALEAASGLRSRKAS